MNFYRHTKRMKSDEAIQLRECPRCRQLGFERMRSYAHCTACLYFVDFEEPLVSIDLTEKLFRDVFLPKSKRNLKIIDGDK